MALIGEATLLTYLYFKKKREGAKQNEDTDESNKKENEEENSLEDNQKKDEHDVAGDTKESEIEEKKPTSVSESESSQQADDAPTAASRWRSLITKSSSALQASRDSAS